MITRRVSEDTVFSVNRSLILTPMKMTDALMQRKSCDSSVGVALGYGLDDRGVRVRIPAGLGIFLVTAASRTALELTKPPIQCIPGAFYLGVKRPGREADHSPPSSAEVKECV
jgi:hypothetical protein